MALEEQAALMVVLSDMGEGLPGLDVDSLLQNIVDKADYIKDQKADIEESINEDLERGTITKEEAKTKIKDEVKKLIDEYKTKIKQMVIEAIAKIKTAWKEISSQLKQIPKDVASAIANILLPPAIGVPPVAPNPIYAINLAAQTKSVLVAILDAIASSMVKLIGAANLVLFELPQPVLVVGETIKILDTLLNTIPV